MADERVPRDELSMVRPVQAFRLLGIGRTLGYKLLKNGTLPKVRIGESRWRRSGRLIESGTEKP